MVSFKVGACAVVLCGSLLWCFTGSGAVAPRREATDPAATRNTPSLEQPVVDADRRIALASADQAAAWGSLQGRFVFDGTPPEPEPLEINKDPEVCGKNRPVSESLVVNPTNRGIANVVVWLDIKKGDPAPPIHPGYQATAEERIKFDNLDCRFVPHICLLRTTQTLEVVNSDPVVHNAAFFLSRNDPANVVVAVKGSFSKRFALPENLPCEVSCSIHAWMRGRVLIKDHPYMAVSDKDGRFALKNLPAGEWKFRIWHELPGYVTTVRQDGNAVKWEKGILPHSVRPGDADLGTFSLSGDLFKPVRPN
jgi:hypothetical protein